MKNYSNTLKNCWTLATLLLLLGYWKQCDSISFIIFKFLVYNHMVQFISISDFNGCHKWKSNFIKMSPSSKKSITCYTYFSNTFHLPFPCTNFAKIFVEIWSFLSSLRLSYRSWKWIKKCWIFTLLTHEFKIHKNVRFLILSENCVSRSFNCVQYWAFL